MAKINHTIDEINKLRGWSIHSKKGAVMLHCFPTFTKDGTKEQFYDEFNTLLKQVKVYEPKNPNHFWMGIVQDPHITIHHGFELNDYERQNYDNGEMEWKKDIHNLLNALDKEYFHSGKSFRERLLENQFKATPEFFNPNPVTMHEGETAYYTIVLKMEPTKEMKIFRNTLLKVFPHTANFLDWSTHMSLVTVADEISRDYLLYKLNNVYINIYDLKLGYNINK